MIVFADSSTSAVLKYMGLKAEDAIRVELRNGGRQRNTCLLFRCSECGQDIWVKNNPQLLTKHKGKCKNCKNYHPRVAFSPGQSNTNKKKQSFEWLFNALIRVSKKRGLPVSLTFEQFLGFIAISCCHYCGRSVNWAPHRVHRSMGIHFNLDRKDSALGYDPVNLVVCCWPCNRIKGNLLTYGEMLLLAPVLQTIRLNRSMGVYA